MDTHNSHLSEPSHAPILRIRQLTKRYRRLVAVNQLDLDVYPGDFVGFIGPNGAGKSTTFGCISGVLERDAGSIEIAGLDTQKHPVSTRGNIGFVPQTLALLPYLTGEEFLRFVATIRGVEKSAQDAQIEELLSLTELQDARHRVLKEYSGGMARKIAICAALMGPPKLLLLDESFVGLDPESTHRIRTYLKGYCEQGGAIILSSHILDMVQRICTKFVIIHKGEIARVITFDELEQAIDLGEYDDLTALYLDATQKSLSITQSL